MHVVTALFLTFQPDSTECNVSTEPTLVQIAAAKVDSR